MNWTDKAIILSTFKHSETSGIATMLTFERGIHKGYVRGLKSKKNCGIYQTGNEVQASWQGRLSEHLGNYSCETIKHNAVFLLTNPQKLLALSAICSIIEQTLPERESQFEIYCYLEKFIEILKNNNDWQKNYVIFELKLLEYLGYGLDLSSCVATGCIDNLAYVSPKSARAVSLDAGKAYHSKLLILPDFIKNNQISEISTSDIKNGLNLCGYFLDKFAFKPYNRKIPNSRIRLAKAIN